MAICTIQGHVSRAIDFYNKAISEGNGMYFCIAKPTVWSEADLGVAFVSGTDYEQNPPTPKNTDSLLDVVGYKRVESAFLVVQDNIGELDYRGTKWKVVDAANASVEGARWVYISAYLSYNELPTNVVYRQVGVYSGLTKAVGVLSSKYALNVNEVADAGLLEVIDNRKPVYRSADLREHMKLIIEF